MWAYLRPGLLNSGQSCTGRVRLIRTRLIRSSTHWDLATTFISFKKMCFTGSNGNAWLCVCCQVSTVTLVTIPTISDKIMWTHACINVTEQAHASNSLTDLYHKNKTPSKNAFNFMSFKANRVYLMIPWDISWCSYR